jgi:hypothetical protein
LTRNVPFLVNCRNRRPNPNGLHGFYAVTSPETALPEAASWPFPQYFLGRTAMLGCFGTAIYYVGSLTPIDTINPDTGASAPITAGYDWHFVDLGDTWLLLNGACCVWKTAASENVYVSDAVTITTGTAHKEGRAFLAGFDADDTFARVDWPAYWAANAGTATVPTDGLESNHVWYSSVFAPDLLWLLDSYILDYAKDLMWRDEAHVASMPFQGQVWGTVEFGSGVLAYGEGGIILWEPRDDGRYVPRRFAGLPDGVGITPGANTRTHYVGDRSVQYFVDGEDELWRLTPDMQAVRIGYSEFISTLERDDLLLAYDPLHQDLYISDGADALMLAGGVAMCRPPWGVSTLVRHGSTLYGVKFATASPTAATIETSTFTTESGFVETLGRTRLVGLHSRTNPWKVASKTRVNIDDDFTTGSATEVDERGVVKLNEPMLECRLQLTSTDATKVTLEDLSVEISDGLPDTAAKLAASAPGAATE